MKKVLKEIVEETLKRLNKKTSQLNKLIQESIQNLNEEDIEKKLAQLRKNIVQYNQISTNEFDSLKKILGSQKFAGYLKIKNDLTTKVKSLLVGTDATGDRKTLPPSKVIIEGK